MKYNTLTELNKMYLTSLKAIKKFFFLTKI